VPPLGVDAWMSWFVMNAAVPAQPSELVDSPTRSCLAELVPPPGLLASNR
jgi:hypothetical protein